LADLSNPLTVNNLYARSLHTPFYQMDMGIADRNRLGYGPGQATSSNMTLLGASMSAPQDRSRLPGFDVKAYTFRKKPRHYVALKPKNALRIEPIIYLKTSILDEQRQVFKNWDFLRFKMDRFRDNGQPKKKLSPEEMRGARILDVDIILVSPNNRDRIIEDSCPACVMRMDGERKIMHVLAKNFKLSPIGEPLIDIRKGHAVVCIKLNCYCDHHNEQEGFIVRLQTAPEVVRMGGSVKLRICCEARSKTGATEQDAEEEDGLTDIDAPASTGSRSPAPANDQMLQSPSLSYESSSPFMKGHQRTPSSNSSSIASPRSMEERVVNSLAIENSANSSTYRVPVPPKFRQIYPLTPSEGTILGGTRVTIHGANFDMLQNPVVFFGKTPAELVTISHHDVMECTTPPAENLKPGIVAVQIASSSFPLGVETDSVEFLYMAPPGYDFLNLAATSLSYSMSNEYPQDNSLSYVLGAHGSNATLNFGILDDTSALLGNDLDLGLAWAAKQDIVLDFLKTIQTLAPGRVLPSFRSGSGHTLLHMAVQENMVTLVKELLAMGIDHTAMDRNNKTALHFAHMTQNEGIIQLLTEARIPPRPMVPRMDASQPSEMNLKGIVDALIQRHESALTNAVREENQRKSQQLKGMHERSVESLKHRSQALQASSHAPTASTLQDSEMPRVFVEDTDDDDIMEFSDSSSPESRSQDEEMSSNDERDEPETDHKRKAENEPEQEGTSRKMHKNGSRVGSGRLTEKDSTHSEQYDFIQRGAHLWESANGRVLLGEKTMAKDENLVGAWVCDSWSVSSLKDTLESTDASQLPEIIPDTTLHIFALTRTGLHHFTEQERPGHGAVRNLDHWSLLEMENMHVNLNADSKSQQLEIDMCGLVPRSGRDLMGERLQIASANPTDMMESISKAHTGLCQSLGFKPMFGLDQTQSSEAAQGVKSNAWIESTLGVWYKLFNVDDHAKKSLRFEAEGSRFMLQSAKDGTQDYSAPLLGAVMRMLREYDQCIEVRMTGVQLSENGWDRPELVKEVTLMAKSMKIVDQWAFDDCGWTLNTVEGFLQGIESTATTKSAQEPWKSISLANNNFGGEDTVGHLLAHNLAQLNQLEILDLTNCNIGLGGMEAIVHQVRDLSIVKVMGNQSDERWWQWMESLLVRNPLVEELSVGAPVAATSVNQSLISAESLGRLKDLTTLDISTSPINEATIHAINVAVQKCERLRTLSMRHCQLGWTDMASLFNTLCHENRSTKFTLDVSFNPLFDSDSALQGWVDSVQVSGQRTNVPFGITMEGLMVQDGAMRQILQPLENAVCFNELNVKGLCIKRESQVKELEGLSYEKALQLIRPDEASEETCLALGRVIASNTALVMLDISGKPLVSDEDASASNSAKPVNAGRSTGGFGREVWRAFPDLAKNMSLRLLTMDWNRFGEEGMQVFATALRENKGLRVVSCDGNDAYTFKGLKAIEQVLVPSQREQPEGLRFNDTLCVWRFNEDEIMLHKVLMSEE
ncbi:SPT3 Dosage dependent suppressor of Ty-induced promoter mutations-like protein, partial [Lunasporangiospora selenospora]